MRLWALFLRAFGIVLLAFSIIELANIPSRTGALQSLPLALRYFLPGFTGFGVALLCFGGASALVTLYQIRQQQLHATARRRNTPERQPTPLPNLTWQTDTEPVYVPVPPTQASDLAPVAPSWDEMPQALPYGEGELQRLERDRRDGVGAILASNVREAPPPIRITPGTEDQYADAPGQKARGVPNPYLRNRAPIHMPEDREILRSARDKNLRRKFMDEDL